MQELIVVGGGYSGGARKVVARLEGSSAVVRVVVECPEGSGGSSGSGGLSAPSEVSPVPGARRCSD